MVRLRHLKYCRRPGSNSLWPTTLLWLLFAVVVLFLSGCAGGALRQARQEFYSGQQAKAAATLATAKHIPKKDQLLFYMERGAILHHLGEYEASNAFLLKASQLMADQEIISVGRQTTSLVTTERLTEYKGEYSERLWVHTYLMMNFLVLNNFEDALVEAKQALEVLNAYPEALTKDYFTRALVALCYDNLWEYNDAYIEYKKLAELLPDPASVAPDLVRLGSWLGFMDEVAKYKPLLAKEKTAGDKNQKMAEAVVFLSWGSSPYKVSENIVLPPSIRFSFPRYKDRDDTAGQIEVSDGQGIELASLQLTTNLSQVDRAALADRRAAMIAKETARVVAKETIARSVGDNNGDVAEALTRLALFLLEEPDTRSWQILPAWFALVRIPVAPGSQSIRLLLKRVDGRLPEEIQLPEFTIEAGHRRFFSIRR